MPVRVSPPGSQAWARSCSSRDRGVRRRYSFSMRWRSSSKAVIVSLLPSFPHHPSVIPANAGIYPPHHWIAASAAMTVAHPSESRRRRAGERRERSGGGPSTAGQLEERRQCGQTGDHDGRQPPGQRVDQVRHVGFRCQVRQRGLDTDQACIQLCHMRNQLLQACSSCATCVASCSRRVSSCATCVVLQACFQPSQARILPLQVVVYSLQMTVYSFQVVVYSFTPSRRWCSRRLNCCHPAAPFLPVQLCSHQAGNAPRGIRRTPLGQRATGVALTVSSPDCSIYFQHAQVSTPSAADYAVLVVAMFARCRRLPGQTQELAKPAA